MVGMTGFEPAASASRTQRSTKLSHTSLFVLFRRSTQDILYYRDMEMSTGFFKKVTKSFFVDLNCYIVYFVCRIQTN